MRKVLDEEADEAGGEDEEAEDEEAARDDKKRAKRMQHAAVIREHDAVGVPHGGQFRDSYVRASAKRSSSWAAGALTTAVGKCSQRMERRPSHVSHLIRCGARPSWLMEKEDGEAE